ncbi:MAG: intracellular sulfur oxidation DsrE/DsrF family protein [Sulfurimonas sp.]|jgi:intracellular sulfur oxidation DsrE/DsrF family protein|uniref:DsrE family protein n=1 Tax=Sulfurimonas sp. TaxID=2022749 RepID=UPI0039E6B657
MKYIKLASALLLLTMLATPSFAEKQDDTVNVVYQCDFADPKRVHLMLNTLNNAVKHYREHFIDFELDIVALGPCLQYVMKDFKDTGYMRKPYINNGGPTGKGTSSRLKDLQQLGGDNIQMYACGNTMKKKNVKPEQIADYVKLTPAGIIKIIDLQREDYAYIKIK